jgi:hypothetical protein
VTTGTVRDVRRASGRQVVRLAVDGEAGLAWLGELPGVVVTRPGNDFTEVVVGDSLDPRNILAEAQARGERISRFEIVDPPLERVFIDLVGRPIEDEAERHLATDGSDGVGPTTAGATHAHPPVRPTTRPEPRGERA